MKIWDLNRRGLVTSWQPHKFPVYGVQFLDGGRSLLSAGVIAHQVSDLRRWEVASWREIPFAPIELKLCYGLAQTPDLQFMAATCAGEPVRIWKYDSKVLETSLDSENSGWTPTFSRDGRYFAAALGSRARVWEVGSWRPLALLEQPVNGVVSVAFSPDGKRLVTGSDIGGDLHPAVRVWDYTIERDLLSLYSDGPWTGWIEFSPDGNMLLAVSWEGVTELWRAPSWTEIEVAEKGGLAP